MKPSRLEDMKYVNPYESPEFSSEENDPRPFSERHPYLTGVILTAGLIGVSAFLCWYNSYMK